MNEWMASVFFFIVKAAVFKQQISKFCPQILNTEDSFYIYDRPLTEINVIASFCALNVRIQVFFCYNNSNVDAKKDHVMHELQPTDCSGNVA